MMWKEGDRLILEPAARKTLISLIELIDSREPIEEEFPEIADPPPEQFDR